jgi:hypothetical protein
MTRVSFDAKAALTGCADTVVRCLHSAGSDKFRPNSERMQATETRIPAFRDQHSSHVSKGFTFLFQLEDPACGEAREKRQVRKEQLGKHGQESFGQANEICKHRNRGLPTESRKTGGDMHKHKE